MAPQSLHDATVRHLHRVADRDTAAQGVVLSARSARSGSSVIRDLLSILRDDRILSLAGGLPDTAGLPAAEVAEAVERACGAGGDALQYGPTEGEPALRAWIAEHELDGADPGQVLVTHGAQQALGLVVDALVDPGDVVVVERASYVGMLQPLGRAAASILDVGSDADGMRTDELETLLRRGARPTLCYLCPTYQNPTGAVLSEDRRRHLGELAARYRFVVIDDDPYRDLGFGPPPTRLRAHVPAELAVSVGSFSKTVAPGLRVGWAHAPSVLVDAMVTMKQADDLHTSTLSQRVLLDLLGRPGWREQRTGALVAAHRVRGQALVEGLTGRLGRRVAIEPMAGGMFVWATLPECPVDTDALLPRALEHGVAFVPGSAFDHRSRPSRSARLCCATLPPALLDVAAARLAAAVDEAWQDPRTEPDLRG